MSVNEPITVATQVCPTCKGFGVTGPEMTARNLPNGCVMLNATEAQAVLRCIRVGDINLVSDGDHDVLMSLLVRYGR